MLPVSRLTGFVLDNDIGEVWIAAPWEDKTLLQQSLELLSETVVDVNVVPDLHQYRLLNQGISEWGGLPVISLYGQDLDSLRLRPTDLDGLADVVLNEEIGATLGDAVGVS